MANVILVAVIVLICAHGVYSYIHKLRCGGGCCGARDAAPKRVKAADRNKRHYPHRAVLRIDGMTCENCARRVENALNTLPGTWATADLAAGRATVLLKQPPETETLRQAVRQAGYLLLRVEESN